MYALQPVVRHMFSCIYVIVKKKGEENGNFYILKNSSMIQNATSRILRSSVGIKQTVGR